MKPVAEQVCKRQRPRWMASSPTLGNLDARNLEADRAAEDRMLKALEFR